MSTATITATTAFIAASVKPQQPTLLDSHIHSLIVAMCCVRIVMNELEFIMASEPTSDQLSFNQGLVAVPAVDTSDRALSADFSADLMQLECMDTTWICDEEPPFDINESDDNTLESRLAASNWKRTVREWMNTPLIADEEPPFDINESDDSVSKTLYADSSADLIQLEWMNTPLIADEEPPFNINHPSIAAYSAQPAVQPITR
ncbi:hypothetical protein LPJ56_006797, partial [Coemansia sp. RSA 2599]